MSDLHNILSPDTHDYEDKKTQCLNHLIAYIGQAIGYRGKFREQFLNCLIRSGEASDPSFAMSIMHVEFGSLVQNSTDYVNKAAEEHENLKLLAPSGNPADVVVLGVVLSGEFELVEDVPKVTAFLGDFGAISCGAERVADQDLTPDQRNKFREDLSSVSPMKNHADRTKIHMVLDPIAPIRLLQRGAVTGIFTAADALVGNSAGSRPREQWGLFAGNVSCLNLGSLEEGFNADQQLTKSGNNLHPIIDFSKIENANTKKKKEATYCLTTLWEKLHYRRTTLAEDTKLPLLALVPIDLSRVRENPLVHLGLVSTSWIDGKQYRSASNSFNEDGFGARIRECIESGLAQNLERENTIENAQEFLMTVVDTLNRPSRDVPGFKLEPDVHFVKDRSPSNGKFVLEKARAIHPDSSSMGRFFYPIDLHNIRQFRRMVVWRQNQENPLLKNRAFALLPGRPINLLKLRDFLKSDVKPGIRVLDNLIEGLPHYHWNVDCEILPGQGRYILAIVFTPKGYRY